MLRSLQACRAVAALLVVLFHASGSIFALPKYFGHEPLGPVFDFGYAGVDFFFVLSGFIMMHVHGGDIGQPRAVGRYLWKRFTRIYPAYWVMLALLVPVYCLQPQLGTGHERDADVLAYALFLLPHPQNHAVLVVAWTLVFEVFFYALFATLILHRRLGGLLFCVWTAGLMVGPGGDSYPWAFLFSPLHLRFLAGMTVARFVRHGPVPVPRLLATVGAAVFVGTGAGDVGHFLAGWQQTLGYTLGSALMVAGLVEAERSAPLRLPRWLVYLGDASYAIYLVHFVALSLLAKVTLAIHLDQYLPGVCLFGMLVSGAVAVGCLFHHLIEKPLHTWTKRLVGPALPGGVVLHSAHDNDPPRRPHLPPRAA